MQCPRCRMDEVFLSTSGNSSLCSLLTKSVRCHRCCYLYKIPRWKPAPQKAVDEQQPTEVDLNRSVA